MADTDKSLDQLNEEIRLLKRQHKAMLSRDNFMDFVKFTSPHPEDPNDVDRSTYQNARHHDVVAAAVEEVENGNYPFLILTMPPRHGKSELVSRRLPAWLLGRHPEQNVVVATYNDNFAADFGAEVRKIVQSSQYKQVFDGTRLTRGGSAKDRLQTTVGGMATFVGRGGSLTGRGAHCFVSGTMVLTPDGERQIQHMLPGEEVVSFCGGRFFQRKIEAVSRRSRARIYRIATTAGRVVEATADHPFYVDGRWVEAAELTAGDPLLCGVRKGADTLRSGCSEAPQTGAPELLLQRQVLGPVYECEKARAQHLRPLRGAGASQDPQGYSKTGSVFLFGRVLAGGTARGVRGARAFADAALRCLQQAIYTRKLFSDTLLPAVRGALSRRLHACRWEPSVEGWGACAAGEASRHQAIPQDETACNGAGRAPLRSVCGGGATGGASHRREPHEQPGRQLSHAMPTLPPEGSLLRREADFVATVEDTGREADVFDIQVEGTHCFFANGILVHNCLIIDDLIKDAVEASSQTIRDQAWEWFTKVAMTRRMGRKSVIMTFTRWHSDDPIGRLTDPENENYNPKLAERIKIINLPAIAEDDDPMGRARGEPLWPEFYDLEFLEEQRALDPLGFEALYQQRPSLMDGDLFKRENVRYYDETDLDTSKLRIYCASDHAVATTQRADPTVLLTVGVDDRGHIYLIDCWWQKQGSDVVTEAMLDIMRMHKPIQWWAEKGHISKSIGPFLRKRMAETNTWTTLVEVTPAADKATRAQSIAGRFSMGYVHFPKSKWWTEKAINELMAFPNGLHDDFVDALAYVGLGLQSQTGPTMPRRTGKVPRPGTFGWIKEQNRIMERQKRAANGGW